MNIDKSSSYLQYLPWIYQKDMEKGPFLGRFLKIFEKLLSGIDDEVDIVDVNNEPLEGTEQIINRIYEFFDPELTPSRFLKWLACWMALTLRDDWEEVKKRRLIERIISLYHLRGTKKGLEEYIKIYVPGGEIEITEILAPFQIEIASTIGKDTYLGGGPPHFFMVMVTFPEPCIDFHLRVKAVRAIIDLEKPAHTYYYLKTIVPTLQIGKYSTIGKHTLLGDIPGSVL